MTGQGLWKNWNTQEYLEELIRLTFPAAKVNNIVPFTKYITSANGDEVTAQENILYFCNVQMFAGTPASYLAQLSLNGKICLVQEDVNFVLFEALYLLGVGGTCIITGYRITLDNTIKNIQSVEQPPEITGISGRALNAVWFYSNDTYNSNGNYSLAFNCEFEGTTDAVEFIIPGYSMVLNDIGDRTTHGFTTAADIAGAWQAKLRGTLFSNTDLTSNVIVKDINGPIKYFNLSTRGWFPESQAYKVKFTNCVIGTSLNVKYVDPFGAILDEVEVEITSTTFLFFLQNVPVNPLDEPFHSTHLEVTPTVNGVTCPFAFYEFLNG